MKQPRPPWPLIAILFALNWYIYGIALLAYIGSALIAVIYVHDLWIKRRGGKP